MTIIYIYPPVGTHLDVTVYDGYVSQGVVMDSSRYGVLVEYQDAQGRALKHWFSPASRRNPDAPPGKHLDRFGAYIIVP